MAAKDGDTRIRDWVDDVAEVVAAVAEEQRCYDAEMQQFVCRELPIVLDARVDLSKGELWAQYERGATGRYVRHYVIDDGAVIPPAKLCTMCGEAPACDTYRDNAWCASCDPCDLCCFIGCLCSNCA